MATKQITTRIKNKVAELSSWNSSTGVLLDGEIAIVRVPTGDTYTNPVTGESEPVVELLMKVGDGVHKFDEVDSKGNPYLPWLSAKASDVYNWAKEQDPSVITVKYNKGTSSNPSWQSSTLADILKDLETAESAIEGLKSDVAGVRGLLSVDPASVTANGVVQGITYDATTGKFSVSYGLVQTADINDSAVTTAKIANANVTTVKIADSNVTTAKIADGAVTNAKLGSDISTDKINVGTSTTSGTLSAKITSMDAAITANTNKLAGHTDAAINTLIDNKINALDVSEPSASGTSTSFIKTAKQENGKIVVTKANLPTATSSAAGITKLYTSVGTDTDGTVTRKVVNDINTQVQANKADITNLKTAVAGGVHFRGTVTAEPSTSTTTVGDITIAAGDVVIYSGKEYICTAVTEGVPSWEQLGDVTRIGNLETTVNNLDYDGGDFGTSKFVTKVTQTDGKIAATYARPSASDISYGSSSDVNTKLSSIDAAIATKADSGHTHPSYVNQNAFSNIKVSKSGGGTSDVTVAADTATDTVTFVGSNITITGDATNDKVTFAVADGSTSAKGVVKLSSAVDSTSEALAATPKAVKSAYDKATAAAADAASKVASVSLAGGTNNGTLKLTVNGTATDNIAVTGLGSAAYTDSTAYAPKAHASSATTYGAGSSSNYGHVKLSDSTSSTSGVSGGIAATPAAVKAAYDKGAQGIADAAAVSTDLHNNYARLVAVSGKTDTYTMHLGTGIEEIIFDCGGAPV